jgi:hypothetical protein
MNKPLVIRLKSLEYSGTDLGPNFKIVVRAGEKFVEFNKTIKLGGTYSYNEIILRVFAKEPATEISLSIEVSESDPLYDDVGSAQFTIKIPAPTEKVAHLCTVPVIGKGWEKLKRARIKIGLEIEVESTIRYVKDVLPDGWLRVKLDQGHVEALPYMLKVALHGKEHEGRENFEILEGVHQGKTASVGLLRGGRSYLVKDEKHSTEAALKYSLSKKKLTIRGLGKFDIDMHPSNPIPVGIYPVEIPDAPHDHGRRYVSSTRYAKTWFRLGREGDRYLHVGRESAGCITVLQKRKWTPICLFLLRARKDSKTVGILKVVR